MSVYLHQFIQKHNYLSGITTRAQTYFKAHPNAYKATLMVNHLFRTTAMYAFSSCMPYSQPINQTICFGGSLFYRITVENNCPYKFALPSFAGSLSLSIAKAGCLQSIAAGAFLSLKACAIAPLSVIPFSAYILYTTLTVDYDVDHQKNGCCKSP